MSTFGLSDCRVRDMRNRDDRHGAARRHLFGHLCLLFLSHMCLPGGDMPYSVVGRVLTTIAQLSLVWDLTPFTSPPHDCLQRTSKQMVDYCEASYLEPGANKREVSRSFRQLRSIPFLLRRSPGRHCYTFRCE